MVTTRQSRHRCFQPEPVEILADGRLKQRVIGHAFIHPRVRKQSSAGRYSYLCFTTPPFLQNMFVAWNSHGVDVFLEQEGGLCCLNSDPKSSILS